MVPLSKLPNDDALISGLVSVLREQGDEGQASRIEQYGFGN